MSFYTIHGKDGVVMADSQGVTLQSVTTDLDSDDMILFGRMWHAMSDIPFDSAERYDDSLAEQVVDMLNLRSRKPHRNGHWEAARHLVESFVGARVWSKGLEAGYACGSRDVEELEQEIEELTHSVRQYEATLSEVPDWRDLPREAFVGGYRHTRDLHTCAFKHRGLLQERAEKIRAGHLWKPTIYTNGVKMKEGGTSDYLLERARLIPDD